MIVLEEVAVGSAGAQGKLWGHRARDWAQYNEPGQLAFYEAVFDDLGVGRGTRLLDVGCGSGFGLQQAGQRGATLAGIDAARAASDITAASVVTPSAARDRRPIVASWADPRAAVCPR